MVKVNFNLTKKDFVLIGLFVVLVGLGFGYAYGGTNPAIEGHSVGEIDFSGGFNVPSGNVGIGVPTPTQKLDVNGNIQTTGFIKSNTGMRSSKYCDVNGANCKTTSQMGGGSVPCTWGGWRGVYGNVGGCNDDLYVHCSHGKVNGMHFGC